MKPPYCPFKSFKNKDIITFLARETLLPANPMITVLFFIYKYKGCWLPDILIMRPRQNVTPWIVCKYFKCFLNYPQQSLAKGEQNLVIMFIDMCVCIGSVISKG